MYGKAQFQPGMEEPVEVVTVTTAGTLASTATTTAALHVMPAADASEAEAESNIMQKGLFLVVILGCVAVYIRINTKKNKQFQEKSIA